MSLPRGRKQETLKRSALTKPVPTATDCSYSAAVASRVSQCPLLVARLEEFPRSIVELSGGHPVVQYRGRLLPLASLSSILRSDADIDSRDGAVQVIVFMDGDRQIGIVVDEIIDIVEDSIGSMRSGREPGLLGSAVVAGHVTDFLDMQAVLEAADLYVVRCSGTTIPLHRGFACRWFSFFARPGAQLTSSWQVTGFLSVTTPSTGFGFCVASRLT